MKARHILLFAAPSLFGLASASCAPSAPAAVPVASPTSPTAAITAAPPPSGSGSLGPAEAEAAARLTAATIDAPLRFLAHDLLEGRAPGSRGDALAVEFIAAEMESMGLQPGVTENGTKSWFQKVPLVGITTKVPPTLTFAAQGKGAKTATFAVPTDMVVMSGVQDAKAAVDASDVVFVGYGMVAPEYHWDDYKGVDVKGKVVLVMNDDPSSDPALFGGKRRLWYGRWDYKYLEAAKHGAAGAIIIHTTPSAAYPWQVVVSSDARERFQLPAAPGDPRLVAEMWATEEASRKIAALGGKDLDALRAAAEKREFTPVSLGVKLGFGFTNALRTIESENVVGVLPGTDPALAKEAVVYSAHHDHLGAGDGTAPKNGGDSIFNGAVDNASGCATILAIAQAAALSKPTKRSRVFLAVTAEEQGLLGSEWYSKHPTFPAGRIAVDINVDSANVLGRTTDVGFTGYGRSSADAIVEAVAKAQGRTVHNEPFPEKGGYYRSDQFSFAKIGVPGIYVRGGPTYVGRAPGWGAEQTDLYEKRHYHQPSDEYQASWDLSGAVEDAQLLLLVGTRIADDPQLPAWKPGDEFEAARKAALASP
jgi:Zn-dependent M28 family amino/carboxypeptidase